MNLQLRDSLLVFIVAVAVATPAFGQTAAPAASSPDLSGAWGRNVWLFEPPSSGPGPVVSKLRRPDGTLTPRENFLAARTWPELTKTRTAPVKK